MDDFSIDVKKIAAETIASLSKTAAAKVVAGVKRTVKDALTKAAIDFDLPFQQYLTAAKERCEKVKTLLYRQEPQSLYSFYVSLNVRRGRKVLPTRDVNTILDIGHKLIITGTGGIGKTMMLKYFFVDCVKHTDLIPVLVELRGLSDREAKEVDLAAYIYENLNLYHFNLEEKYFKYSLEAGCYLILFDGLDEVRSDLADKVTQEIARLSTKYSDNYFIVSSRPSDEFMGWGDFVELSAQPMTKVQALELIQRLDYDVDIKRKFYQALDTDLFERYKSFASNPLLLTIMLITFESQATIPEQLNDFYEQAFSALFSRHDASKGGFRRDIASKLSYEEFRGVFSYFCFKTYFKSLYEFKEADVIAYIQQAKEKITPGKAFTGQQYLRDLTSSVCMLLHEGLNYKFAHRSFQEYFAALYTTQLDDKTQQDILSRWIKNSRYLMVGSNAYLPILYNLQKERFIKNVLSAGLSRLKKQYDESGRDPCWLIEKLFSSVGVVENLSDGRNDLVVSIRPRSNYWFSLINISCDCLDISHSQIVAPYQELAYQAADKFLKIYVDDGDSANVDVTFQHLKAHTPELYTDIIQALSFHADRFETILALIEQHQSPNDRGKRSLDSLLDEL